MSTWKVVVGRDRNTPVDISTDDPVFREAFPLPLQYQLYTLKDAMAFIGYRMKPGDVVMTMRAPTPVGPICPGCGDECTGVWVDFGVGRYEYWGAPGIDTQWAYVSSCCEQPLPEPQRSDDDD